MLESVGRANTALDSFEKKSEASHAKVIRISDQTRSSVQRLIASLEKQPETYGKSGVDRPITQRNQLLQRYNLEPQAIDGEYCPQTYPTPGNPNTAGGAGATHLSLNISGSGAGNFKTGQFVTPQFVTDPAMAAQYSSYGRTQQSANMQLPGLTVA